MTFRQCGNVDVVYAELSGNEGSMSSRPISILIIQKSRKVPGCKLERLAGRCAKFLTAGKRCPTGAVTRSGSKERAMFRPPFLGPSSCEVSSVDHKKGCSVTLKAAGGVCRSSPRPQRPSHQSHLRAGHRLDVSSSILNLPPSPMDPSPQDL